MADAAVTGAVRLKQNTANTVMAQRNQAIGPNKSGAASIPGVKQMKASEEPGPMLAGGGCKAGSAPKSEVVPNEAQPKANDSQLTKQQQRILNSCQEKMTDAYAKAQKNGDYNSPELKKARQEVTDTLKAAGIPLDAMK